MRPFIGAAFSCCLLVQGSCEAEKSAENGHPGDAAISEDVLLSLTRDGDNISVPDGYRRCDTDADCTYAAASCSGCCVSVAIDATMDAEYQEKLVEVCAEYNGGMCDCAAEDEVPQCVDQLCVLVARSQVESCFSPDGRAESAREPGSVGCSCSTLDERVCKNDLEFSCTRVGRATSVNTFAWEVSSSGCSP